MTTSALERARMWMQGGVSVCIDFLPYLLPFLALLPRALLCVRFARYMNEHPSEDELDRNEHRSLVTALAGFSFAGLLGLVALPGSLNERAHPIWYMLFSFLSYMAVLNLQGYKARRWHDQLGDTLYDLAALGMIASILSLIFRSELPTSMRIAAVVLGLATWGSDYWVRIRLAERFLKAKENVDVESEQRRHAQTQ